MKAQITTEAEADLEVIGDYVARGNPVRAISFVRELYQLCLDIVDMPQAWPVVPRYEHHGVRRRVLGRYLIFYRIGADSIIILHILNGAMDVEAVLFPDGLRPAQRPQFEARHILYRPCPVTSRIRLRASIHARLRWTAARLTPVKRGTLRWQARADHQCTGPDSNGRRRALQGAGRYRARLPRSEIRHRDRASSP